MVREFYASYVATLQSQMIGRLPPPNRPHRSRSEYGACRLTFPCLPSPDFYTARVLMLLGPLSLPCLTTDALAQAIAERDHQEVDGPAPVS